MSDSENGVDQLRVCHLNSSLQLAARKRRKAVRLSCGSRQSRHSVHRLQDLIIFSLIHFHSQSTLKPSRRRHFSNHSAQTTLSPFANVTSFKASATEPSGL